MLQTYSENEQKTGGLYGIERVVHLWMVNIVALSGFLFEVSDTI
jgi:hypothetical protein